MCLGPDGVPGRDGDLGYDGEEGLSGVFYNFKCLTLRCCQTCFRV